MSLNPCVGGNKIGLNDMRPKIKVKTTFNAFAFAAHAIINY